MNKKRKRYIEIKCPCGATSKAKSCDFVGNQQRDSGFYPLGSHTGEMIWLCPDCLHFARQYAFNLYNIIQNKDVYFPSLLKDD